MTLVPDDAEPTFEEPKLTPDAEPPQFEQSFGDRLHAVASFPEALKDRIIWGNKTNGLWGQLGADMLEGFGNDPVGFSPEHEKELSDLGIFHQPGTQPSALRLLNESVMRPAAQLGDAVMRGVNAGIFGAAGIVNRANQEFTPGSEEAGAEIKNFAQFMMVASGEHPMVRAESHPLTGIQDKTIGGLPKLIDFENANHVLTGGNPSPEVTTKLQRIYEERGIHPAEVVQDAAADPVLHQNLMLKGDTLPEPYAGLEVNGLTYRDVAPRMGPDTLQAGIATRYLPNGQIVPAPEAVASYLKKFGEEAGFNFRVGPEQTGPRDTNSPWYQKTNISAEGKQTTLAQVYMPSTSRELLNRWYGLSPEQILFHEVGHALDDKVLNDAGLKNHEFVADLLNTKEGEPTKFGAIHEEMLEASHEFRPKLWKQQPEYNTNPEELMADAIASYLSNPNRRAKMPEFAARYGAKLDPYLDMVNRNLPKLGPEGRYDGEWEAPPGGGGFGPPGDTGGGGRFGGDVPQTEGPPPGPDADRRARILDRIDVGGKDPSKKLTLDRIYTNTVDQFFPVSKAREYASGSAISDPYKLLRLSAGWAGKAERMLHHDTFDFKSYEPNGESLDAILKPVVKDVAGFRAFIASARAAELESKGIKTGFPMEDVVAEGRAGVKKYGATMEKLVNYQNRISAYLRDSGVLSDAMYDAMLEANKLFVPFHVVMDDARAGIERIGDVRNPIKRIEGSERKKIDPLESVIKNTYLLTAMAEKNFTRRALIDMLRDAPDGAPTATTNVPAVIDSASRTAVGEWLGHNGAPPDLADLATEFATPDRKGEVSLFRNGVRETWKVDEDIAEATKGLNRDTADLAVKLLQPLSSSLRAGAVLTPDFALRHVLRDYVYAFVTTKNGVFTPVDMVKGAVGLYVKDKDFWDWKAGGGGGVSYVSLDRNYLQEDLAKLTGQTGLFTRAFNVVYDPRSTWLQAGKSILGLPIEAVKKYGIHPAQMLTEMVTSMTHLGAYKKEARRLERTAPEDTGKANILNAAFTSRDTAVDAARIGAQMHSYNSISAFANIKIQDTDRIVRAFKDDPMGTSLKVALGITFPSVLLWAYQHKDSRWNDIPDWEHDAYWNILSDKWEPTNGRATNREDDMVRQDKDGNWYQNNGTIFRIPKPFAAGVMFGSGPERILNAWKDDQPGQAAAWVKAFQSATVGDVLPNAISPALDWLGNRSQFTGATLVPGQLEKGLPEYQYTPYTTETAKALAKVISAFPGIRGERLQEGTPLSGASSMLSSPIGLETLVRGWTGNLGLYALQATDYGLKKAGVIADPPEPPLTLSDIPVVRAFTVRYPAGNIQAIQEFYDGANAFEKTYNSFNQKKKEGDGEALHRIDEMGGETTYKQVAGFKKSLSNLSAVIRNVDKDPAMKDFEKRQLIDSLYYAMVQIGHRGRDLLRKLDTGTPTK